MIGRAKPPYSFVKAIPPPNRAGIDSKSPKRRHFFLAALVTLLMLVPPMAGAQSAGKTTRVRESMCQVAGGKPENADSFYSLIWSADQDLLIVNDNKRLSFDKVTKVETAYPFNIVYASTESQTTLIARFVVPDYATKGDEKYPQEQVVSRDKYGVTSTDMCGIGE